VLSEGNAFDKERTARMLLALRGDRPREEVAKAVGISVFALEMYESAQRIPRDEIKTALAQYYDTCRDYIF
jgi:LmbE family N-acetylglucosaminyl deacetylase